MISYIMSLPTSFTRSAVGWLPTVAVFLHYLHNSPFGAQYWTRSLLHRILYSSALWRIGMHSVFRFSTIFIYIFLAHCRIKPSIIIGTVTSDNIRLLQHFVPNFIGTSYAIRNGMSTCGFVFWQGSLISAEYFLWSFLLLGHVIVDIFT